MAELRWFPCGAQVIRIQPNESIYLKINNKVPGLGLRLDTTKLDLSYSARYNAVLPDAYERLILDVVNGDKRLFIRNDELEVRCALRHLGRHLMQGLYDCRGQAFIQDDKHEVCSPENYALRAHLI